MQIVINNSTIVVLLIIGLLGFFLPVGGMIYWSKKKHAEFIPFLCGFAMCFVFVNTVQDVVHNIFIGNEAFQQLMNEQIVLSMLYAAVICSFFEIGGTYFGLKWFLKKYPTKEVCVSFGLGFAGCYAFFMTTVNMLMKLMGIVQMNAMTFEEAISSLGITDEEVIEEFYEYIQYYADTSIHEFIGQGFAAVTLIAIQVAVAVFVFSSIRERKWQTFFVAIGIRFVYDIVSSFYAMEILKSVVIFDIIIVSIAVLSLWLARNVYLNMQISEIEAVEEKKKFAYQNDKSGKSLRNVMNESIKNTVSIEEQNAAFDQAMQDRVTKREDKNVD